MATNKIIQDTDLNKFLSNSEIKMNQTENSESK